MRWILVAGALGAAFLFALWYVASTRAQAPVPHSPGNQSVSFELTVGDDGTPVLSAYSLSAFTIDPRELSFTATRRGEADAKMLDLRTMIGLPVVPASPAAQRGGGSVVYAMTVTFGAPPADGGLFDVTLHAEDGFAHAPDGRSLPFRDWSTGRTRLSETFSWPTDEQRANLDHLRMLYVGRDLYAYGGTTLRCGRYAQTFSPRVPLRVIAIERDQGRFDALFPGGHGGMAGDPRFFAGDPLRFVFRKPEARPLGWGGSIDGPDCPAVVLADWQIHTTFSNAAPPPSTPEGNVPRQLRKGWTRDQVAWLLGYPNVFADRDAIERLDQWAYVHGPHGSMTVTFADGRVAAFTLPGGP